MKMDRWFPVHLHDWPDGVLDLPLAGALVNVEWNIELINNYYGWNSKWPEDPLQGMLRFMHSWEQLAFTKGIKLLPGAKVYFALENIDWIKDIDVIPELKNAGLVSLQIFHSYSNDYYNQAHGLTDKGKQLLKMADKYGLIIDLSHIQGPGLYDIIRNFNGRYIISHVVCEALFSWSLTRRSNALSDRELTECNAKLYGVPFVDDLISPRSEKRQQESAVIENIADHIMHLINTVGLKRVAIGPDYFDYARYYAISGIETKTAKSMDSLAGLSHLSECLYSKGLTESQVDKIFWGNAKKYFDDKFDKPGTM